MNPFSLAISSFLAVLEKVPVSEMGASYWLSLIIAFFIVAAGVLSALLLWKRGRKILSISVFLTGIGLAIVLGFFAESQRQPQEINDPGLPDVELPELDFSEEELPELES